MKGTMSGLRSIVCLCRSKAYCASFATHSERLTRRTKTTGTSRKHRSPCTNRAPIAGLVRGLKCLERKTRLKCDRTEQSREHVPCLATSKRKRRVDNACIQLLAESLLTRRYG